MSANCAGAFENDVRILPDNSPPEQQRFAEWSGKRDVTTPRRRCQIDELSNNEAGWAQQARRLLNSMVVRLNCEGPC